MTGSHILLHCRNPMIEAARGRTWDNKQPGSVIVLLANPEESGAGRIMESGGRERDPGGTHGWIAWEHERREEGG
jgi:hypothetical protein